MGGQPDFKNKTILDFGCGHGAMCLDIAKYRPKKIIAVSYTHLTLPTKA